MEKPRVNSRAGKMLETARMTRRYSQVFSKANLKSFESSAAMGLGDATMFQSQKTMRVNTRRFANFLSKNLKSKGPIVVLGGFHGKFASILENITGKKLVFSDILHEWVADWVRAKPNRIGVTADHGGFWGHDLPPFDAKKVGLFTSFEPMLGLNAPRLKLFLELASSKNGILLAYRDVRRLNELMQFLKSNRNHFEFNENPITVGLEENRRLLGPTKLVLIKRRE
ncbi:hypothetical protein HZB88_02850 [archaeon]|nr:hypothetical protein [archaeon]